MSKKKLLWFSPKWMLPSEDGARLATRTLLQGLAKRGYHIDVVAIVGRDEAIDEAEAKALLGIQTLQVFRRSDLGQGMDKFLRAVSRSFHHKDLALTFVPYAEMRESLQSVSFENYDAAVFDGPHAAAAFSSDLLRKMKSQTAIVYRAHNVESTLWKQNADRTRIPFWRSFLAKQARLVGQFEGELVQLAQCTAAISDYDAAEFKKLNPGARVTTVRMGLFPQEPAPETAFPEMDRKIPLVFVGRLDWLPNRRGLEWFLTQIWPGLHRARPGLSLEIVGSGDCSWLKSYEKKPGIHVLGRVPDLEPVYRRAALALVPLFQASGIRVKTIEAAKFSRACISTSLGVNSLDLVHNRSYLRAETVTEWREQLMSLQPEDCIRLGERAHSEMKLRFSESAVVDSFDAIFSKSAK